ncbi:hypothetical protein G3A43_07975 [Paraburkholderia aspalathi]|nr:hypothetical protein [Paraburkholderia aspalathi]MBK3780193.1 hypothetical protein [Paraburkholderia aspalathi]
MVTQALTDAVTAAVKRDTALHEEVRAELHAEPLRLIRMYVGDFLSALVTTAAEALVAVATIFVWAWLAAPATVIEEALSSANTDAMYTLGWVLFLLTFIMTFFLRAVTGGLSKTYRSRYARVYEKRRAHERTVELVEAVLQQHGLLPEQVKQ